MENNEPLLKDEEEKIFMGADSSSSTSENTDSSAQETDHVIPGVLISKREVAKDEEKETSQPADTPKATFEEIVVSEEQPIISEIPITPIISEDAVTENIVEEKIPQESKTEEVVNFEPQIDQSNKEEVSATVTESTPSVNISNSSENVYTAATINNVAMEEPSSSLDSADPVVVSEPQEVKEQFSTEKKKNDSKKIVSLVVTLVLTFITVYLLVQTCLGFYYGFKYKNYVASQNQTTEATP